MIYPEKVKILAKKNLPKPEEARYWIDLTADPYGGIWKVWNGLTWIRVFASSGSGGGIEEAPSDGNLYGRKNLVWQEIDIPDVSIYATKTELDLKADKDSVPDLSDYLTASDIAKYYQPKGDYLTEIPEGYLTITEADGRYALKDESGGEVDIDLSDYLTIASAESTYATKTEVLTVREYALTIELNKQDTLLNGVNIKSIDGQSIVGSGAIKVWKEAPTDAKLYGRLSALWVEILLPTDYVTEDDLSEWTLKIDAKLDILVSGTNIKTINGTSLLGSGNITLETPEGGLSDAASDGKLYGRKDGTWSEIVIPDISGLATKSELSSKLDTETYNADKATFALKTEIPDTSTFITTETADGKYQPKGSYLTSVPAEYVTESELSLKGYATTDLIPDISTKQDTLVSGTNIKTINGASVLGSGNITIETPEGGISDAPQDGKTYGRKDALWSEITIPDTSALATKAEIADMATLTWVGEQGYLTKHQDISNLATKLELASKANTSDLSNYLTTANASTIYETISGALSKYLPIGEYALKSEIPSLSGYATESYVDTQVSNLVNSAPEALNTLDELAAALNDDSNFATTVTSQIASKLDITTYTSDKETFALKTELSGKADSSALANYVTTATAESIYAKKSEIPSVPTTVSSFTNDAGYITEVPSEYVKEDELKTINGNSIIGAGDISIGQDSFYTNSLNIDQTTLSNGDYLDTLASTLYCTITSSGDYQIKFAKFGIGRVQSLIVKNEYSGSISIYFTSSEMDVKILNGENELQLDAGEILEVSCIQTLDNAGYIRWAKSVPTDPYDSYIGI